jgi:hypothetical protein
MLSVHGAGPPLLVLSILSNAIACTRVVAPAGGSGHLRPWIQALHALTDRSPAALRAVFRAYESDLLEP